MQRARRLLVSGSILAIGLAAGYLIARLSAGTAPAPPGAGPAGPAAIEDDQRCPSLAQMRALQASQQRERATRVAAAESSKAPYRGADDGPRAYAASPNAVPVAPPPETNRAPEPVVERFAGRARKEVPWDRIDPMREGRFALEGTLDDRIFQKEFNAGMKEVRPTYHCIRELGWRPPDGSDAYEVTFALRLESNAAGGVEIVDAEIKHASLSDAALEECMLNRLRGASFETGPVYDARLRLDFLEVVNF